MTSVMARRKSGLRSFGTNPATVHDPDVAALSALMSEWTRTDRSFAQRVSNLRSGGVDASNGTTLLDALSLLDDGVLDSLNGGPANNWLL